MCWCSKISRCSSLAAGWFLSGFLPGVQDDSQHAAVRCREHFHPVTKGWQRVVITLLLMECLAFPGFSRKTSTTHLFAHSCGGYSVPHCFLQVWWSWWQFCNSLFHLQGEIFIFKARKKWFSSSFKWPLIQTWRKEGGNKPSF